MLTSQHVKTEILPGRRQVGPGQESHPGRSDISTKSQCQPRITEVKWGVKGILGSLAPLVCWSWRRVVGEFTPQTWAKTTYQAVCLFFYFLRVGTTAHTYRPNAQRLEKMVFGSIGLECRMSEKELTRDKCKVDKGPNEQILVGHD